MSAAARSVYLFGIYLAATGAGFLFLPDLILPLFGFAATDEVWIRIVGMLVLFLSLFYIGAARAEATFFFRMSIPVRISVLFFFATFVMLGMAPPTLIAFAVIDGFGALWTAKAMRSVPVPTAT